VGRAHWALPSGNYRIICFIRPNQIDVLAVIHEARQLPWTSEK